MTANKAEQKTASLHSFYLQAKEIFEQIQKIQRKSDLDNKIQQIENECNANKEQFYVPIGNFEYYKLVEKNAAVNQIKGENADRRMKLSDFTASLQKLNTEIQQKSSFTDDQIFVEPMFDMHGMYDFEVIIFEKDKFEKLCESYNQQIETLKQESKELIMLKEKYERLQIVVSKFLNLYLTCVNDEMVVNIDEYKFITNCHVKCIEFYTENKK